MDATLLSDPAAPVRYALSNRPAADDRVDIVLDLFRGGVPILTKTVAQVERVQAVLVMVKCRRYLDLRGVDPAGPIAPPAPAKPAPERVVAPAAKPAARPATASARPATLTPRPAAVPAKAAPEPAARSAAPAARAATVRSAATPIPPRRERAPEPRTAAPAAAFDFMFKAG